MMYESVSYTVAYALNIIIVGYVVFIMFLALFIAIMPVWIVCLYVIIGGTGFVVWLSSQSGAPIMNPFTIAYFFVSMILYGTIMYFHYPLRDNNEKSEDKR